MAALTNRYEDDDAYHLPPGMERVGYDEETERYTFRHGDELWLGEPGSLYGGKMKWAGRYKPRKQYTGSRSDSRNDDKILKLITTSPKALGNPTLLQESDNEWGVPVTSISATGEKPPDTSIKRRVTQLKKAASPTAMAMRITRRLSSKRVSAGGNYQENEEENDGEKEAGTETTEKGLPTTPTN